MNTLVVDAGNSVVKYRLYSSEGLPLLDYLFAENAEDSEWIQEKILELNPEEIWISDVRGGEFPIPQSGIHKYINAEINYPFQFDSAKYSKTGSDRLCLIAGISELYSADTLVCVISLGSAITYNTILPGRVFTGGAISPGLNMRFRSLHEFTGKLPSVSQEGTLNYPTLNTEEAIRSGVILGIIYEIEGFIEALKTQSGTEPVVILTGGNALYFENRLKKPNFVIPDLVLQGLYRLATLNRNA